MEWYKKVLYRTVAASLAGLIVMTQFPVVLAHVDIISAVAKDPTDVPPRISRSNPTTVTVDLVAKEVAADIAPGKKFWFWTFAEKKGDTIGSATVPGPLIRVMEGDTVVINLTNALDSVEPHNLDFHAGFGAIFMDIEPGETKTLTFKAERNGAYIYHCGAEGMPWEHVAYGMYGLIMVEPKGGLSKVDKEFYIGQGEWYLKYGIEDHPGIDSYSLDEDKALAEQPDYFTFNGHTMALKDPLLYGNAIEVDKGATMSASSLSMGDLILVQTSTSLARFLINTIRVISVIS
jgi:nitrite reductase (NO-forming)